MPKHTPSPKPQPTPTVSESPVGKKTTVLVTHVDPTKLSFEVDPSGSLLPRYNGAPFAVQARDMRLERTASVWNELTNSYRYVTTDETLAPNTCVSVWFSLTDGVRHDPAAYPMQKAMYDFLNAYEASAWNVAVANNLIKTRNNAQPDSNYHMSSSILGTEEYQTYTDQKGVERESSITMRAKVYAEGDGNFSTLCKYREDVIAERDHGINAEPVNALDVLSRRGWTGTMQIVPQVIKAGKQLTISWKLAVWYPSRDSAPASGGFEVDLSAI